MSESENTSRELHECPSCGAVSVLFSDEPAEFVMEKGRERVTMSLVVPTGRCTDCGFQFTDQRAEQIRHNAYCRLLGRLTPDEILGLRHHLKLTRSQLAEITGIGEASLSRWERGESVQNAALDHLLYLLSFRENLLRLRLRSEKREPAATEVMPLVPASKLTKFRCLALSEHMVRSSQQFQLRPTGS